MSRRRQSRPRSHGPPATAAAPPQKPPEKIDARETYSRRTRRGRRETRTFLHPRQDLLSPDRGTGIGRQADRRKKSGDVIDPSLRWGAPHPQSRRVRGGSLASRYG